MKQISFVAGLKAEYCFTMTFLDDSTDGYCQEIKTNQKGSFETWVSGMTTQDEAYADPLFGDRPAVTGKLYKYESYIKVGDQQIAGDIVYEDIPKKSNHDFEFKATLKIEYTI